MMTIEEMKKQKKKLGYTNKRIAEETGIPLGTVQKIFAGVTRTPRWEKMQALERLLKREDSFEYRPQEQGEKRIPTCVHEEIAYHWEEVDDRDPSGGTDPKQGSYTIEDYLAIPDERRVELIDGFIYDMASPSWLHQAILTELHAWRTIRIVFCFLLRRICILEKTGGRLFSRICLSSAERTSGISMSSGRHRISLSRLSLLPIRRTISSEN